MFLFTRCLSGNGFCFLFFAVKLLENPTHDDHGEKQGKEICDRLGYLNSEKSPEMSSNQKNRNQEESLSRNRKDRGTYTKSD